VDRRCCRVDRRRCRRRSSHGTRFAQPAAACRGIRQRHRRPADDRDDLCGADPGGNCSRHPAARARSRARRCAGLDRGNAGGGARDGHRGGRDPGQPRRKHRGASAATTRHGNIPPRHVRSGFRTSFVGHQRRAQAGTACLGSAGLGDCGRQDRLCRQRGDQRAAADDPPAGRCRRHCPAGGSSAAAR